MKAEEEPLAPASFLVSLFPSMHLSSSFCSFGPVTGHLSMLVSPALAFWTLAPSPPPPLHFTDPLHLVWICWSAHMSTLHARPWRHKDESNSPSRESLFTKCSISLGSVSPSYYAPFLFFPLSLLRLFLFPSQLLLEASYEKEIIYNGTGTLKASVSLEIIELMRGSHWVLNFEN